MCTENYYWHHDYVRLAWDSGFAFNTHRAKTNYDWSNIGLLDIDKAIRDRDVAIVEKHMGTILNYSLDEDQTKILEPTFVKVFQLSQLSLQYLQFCKRYLDNTVVLLKKEVARYKEDTAKLKKNIEELKHEISDLNKKVKELKQPLVPPTPSIPETFVPPSYKCNVCYKIFLNEDFLVSHVKRRHEPDTNPFQTETDRLQLEIKELKERLNSTEKYIHSDSNKTVQNKQEIIPNNDAALENVVQVDDLKDKLDHLKQYVEQELVVLRNEKRYQEKYEKWFEIVFQRLDSSRNELQGKQEVMANVAGDGDKLVRKDSSTQTIVENYVESETMTDYIGDVVSEESVVVKPAVAEIDVEKIQNDIRINTESHLDQIQGVLEKKLSGGFEVIQTQMNTFWKKLSDIELEKKQNNLNQFQHVIKTIPISIKQRNQNIDLSSDSSSSSSASLDKPMQFKSQPIPAPRVVKQYPVPKRTKIREVRSQESRLSPIKKATVVKPKVAELEEWSSEESSSLSSDGTVEIAKPPVKVTPVKSPGRISGFKNTEVKSKTSSRHLRTPKKDVSESEDDGEQLQVKASTSGQRSSPGSKQAKDPEVTKGIKRDIDEMVNSRLREIGISPHWKGIPEKSYQQAMRVIRHQGDLAKRSFPKYQKIREILLKIMNDRLSKQIKGSQTVIEERKRGESKILISKQFISKKHSKYHKTSRHSQDDLSRVITSNADVRPKPKPRHKASSKHESKRQEQAHTSQDKITLVGMTPVKKKVLFDLEDTSSTPHLVQAKTDAGIPLRQQTLQDDTKRGKYERNIIASSPARKDVKATDDVKPVMQKSSRVLKINDGGSSSSLASFLMESSKVKSGVVEKKLEDVKKDDVSDWDLSDILT